jgi:hypothetical protein
VGSSPARSTNFKLKITIFHPSFGLNVGFILTKTQKRVLDLLLEKGTLNAGSMASEVGASVRMVERAQAELQEAKHIVRPGSKS